MEALNPHEQRALDAIRAAARPALDAGVAQLNAVQATPGGCCFTLKPSTPRACPLAVCVGSGELVGSWGLHETHFEVWEPDLDGQIKWIGRLADCVVDGRIEEWVLIRDRERLAAQSNLALRGEEPWHYRYNSFLPLSLFRRRPDVQHIHYVPYVAV